ncbi:MAG: purine-nucleoside phosphorylase [Candidatus Firestonebacteria bacterium]|nr:purine-nucleoside phosphorylase [Candidatus Firestonebacteria bacterium]
MSTELKHKVDKAVKFLKKETDFIPEITIILGTGLGKLVESIENQKSIPYKNIPNFPESTVVSHSGNLVIGTLSGKKVAALEGRFHYYEGYSMEQVTFPIRVMQKWGAKLLVVSNACGGMNHQFKQGDIMIITDHINFMGVNPLIGANDDDLGPRFPDMCEPYNRELVALTEKVALELQLPIKKGVYIGVTGPNLETPAEYRFMRIIGADVVGMSTVPEVIVAIHAGLKVLGLSCVTDMCLPDALKPANIEEIIKIANETEPKISKLVKEVIKRIKSL